MDEFYEKLMNIILEMIIATYVGIILAVAIKGSESITVNSRLLISLFLISLIIVVLLYIYMYKRFNKYSTKKLKKIK